MPSDDFKLHSSDSDEDSLDEIASEDFPLHFSERNGRLYHSQPSLPYPLPVDSAEQQRLKLTHGLLHQLIGAQYVGPVPDVLAPTTGHRKLALDLCTGTGKWVLDMARDFPHVQFIGIDIVPIATRYPPENVQFEIHDVNLPFRWRTGAVDLVYARSISMAVIDYSVVLQEVGRVLRPNGLFISYEWGSYAEFHPALGSRPFEHIPGIRAFYNMLNIALHNRRGRYPIAGPIHDLLTAAGCFRDITTRSYHMPIGHWPANPVMNEIGRTFVVALKHYADSVKPLLLEVLGTEAQVERLTNAYKYELERTPGLVAELHTVHARRI